MEIVKEYSNGEVTIVWKAHLCTHSAFCAKGLPTVFQPKEKPWIKPNEASARALIDQVRKCPSGALTIYENTKYTDYGNK